MLLHVRWLSINPAFTNKAVMERDPGANEILMKIQNEKNKRYH